jgi:hypothetical protein
VNRGQAVAVLGIVLLVAGAFAPWVTLGSRSSGGLDHDGPAMLVFAGLATVFFIFHWRGARVWARICAGICAVLAVAAAIYDVSDVQDAGLTVGWGLWVCLAGSIVLALGVVLARR